MIRLISFLLLFAALPCVSRATGEPVTPSPDKYRVHELEYLFKQGVSVLAYHNQYYVGKQGGIEIILRDRRILTNGMLQYKLKASGLTVGQPEYFDQPIPEVEKIQRIVDTGNQRIVLPFKNQELDLEYQVVIEGIDEALRIRVEFNKMPDTTRIAELSFDLELFPGIYRGKSFAFENHAGIIPHVFLSNIEGIPGNYLTRPLGKGKDLILAPEDKNAKIRVKATGGEIHFLDTRSHTDHNWFTLSTIIDLKSMKNQSLELVIETGNTSGYEKKPVIGYTQTGYYPSQRKRSVIEVDTNYVNNRPLNLYRLNRNTGKFEVVLSQIPQEWGKYKRYNYLLLDFSGITQEGLYYLGFDDTNKSGVFPVSRTVHEGVWEPVIHDFLPVQMCHMRVKDRNRIWHGHCHLDDAIQAPVSHNHFDGFSQGPSTDTPLKPLEIFPGLNQGGWHDAGDDDVNTNSTSRTVYHLALLKEEFGLTTDQTTVDFEKKEVYMHRPDGVCDIIQNMQHGLNFMLPQYEFAGHGIVGVISNDYETYFIPGTWESMTDNLHYNPEYAVDQRCGVYSGKMDDRFAFTNKDSRAEYRNAYVFAASARVLKQVDPQLAEKCLSWAEKIWNTEQNSTPVYYSSVGVPRNLEDEQVMAAVELYLTTRDKKYLDFVVSRKNHVLNSMEDAGWAVSRVIKDIRDKRFARDYEKRLVTYNDSLSAAFASNPYGTYLDATLWGFGWDILWRTINHYFYIKNYPGIFSIDPLISCNEFMLGVHPYSSVSYVSGVGSELPIPAFGMNRSHYSYTPGGVFSGVNIVEPDFPELMEDHPFIWQQSEYIIHGATPFVFTTQALKYLLNK